MNYTDLWPLIQRDLLACLQADAFLAGLPGMLIEPGAPEATVQAAVTKVLGPQPNGRSGAGYLVLPVEQAFDDNPNLPLGPLKMPVTIQFVENGSLFMSNTNWSNTGCHRSSGLASRLVYAGVLVSTYWFVTARLRPVGPTTVASA